MATPITSYQDPRLRRVAFDAPCPDMREGVDRVYAALVAAGAEYVFGERWTPGDPGRWAGYAETTNPLAFREEAARVLPGISFATPAELALTEIEQAYQRGYNSGYQAGRRGKEARP